MNTSPAPKFIRQSQAISLIALPLALLLMLALHFRTLSDFLVFHARYVPAPAEDKVAHLIAAGNRWPMIHDPHLIGYLALPLFVLCAFGLYASARGPRLRPRARGRRSEAARNPTAEQTTRRHKAAPRGAGARAAPAPPC